MKIFSSQMWKWKSLLLKLKRLKDGSGLTLPFIKASQSSYISNQIIFYLTDLQLDPDSDPHAEASEAKVLPRIKAIERQPSS